MSTLRLHPIMPLVPRLPIRVRVVSLAATLGLIVEPRGLRAWADRARDGASHLADATVTVAGGRIACTPDGVCLDLS